MPPIMIGVGIAFRRVDELGQADGAAGAALIVELHGRNQFRALHRRREIAPGLVPTAAGIGGDHHLQTRLGVDCRRETESRGKRTATHSAQEIRLRMSPSSLDVYDEGAFIVFTVRDKTVYQSTSG